MNNVVFHYLKVLQFSGEQTQPSNKQTKNKASKKERKNNGHIRGMQILRTVKSACSNVPKWSGCPLTKGIRNGFMKEIGLDMNLN